LAALLKPRAHRTKSFLVLSVLCGAALAASRPAHAQIRWDVGAQAGATKRFTTGADSQAPGPGIGPSFGLVGHLAIVPMVRAGLYLAQDTSPAPPASPRTFWAGGIHLRVAPPLLGGAWRTWLAAGAGYAYTYSTEQHASGGMVDVPLGLGLGRKMASTWILFAELGARFGLGFHGPMYDHAAAASAGVAYTGQDSFALSASVGLSFEQ
jgi:hypothetical protein